MKQHKLYKWLLPAVAIVALASCSRSSYPERSPYPQEEVTYYPAAGQLPPGQAKKIYGYQSAKRFAPGHYKRPPYGYAPPTVIIIGDNLAYRDRYGQMYYDNDYGYRYWRNRDGKFYLDNRYAKDVNKYYRKNKRY